MEITFQPTNTSEIHLHVEQLLQNTHLMMAEDLRLTKRVLVLWPGVRLVPLRWESRVQDIGQPETSQLHLMSNGENSPRDPHLNAKTQLQSTTSKLQC